MIGEFDTLNFNRAHISFAMIVGRMGFEEISVINPQLNPYDLPMLLLVRCFLELQRSELALNKLPESKFRRRQRSILFLKVQVINNKFAIVLHSTSVLV